MELEYILNILGVQISFEGFFGDFAFVNPSKLIFTPNIIENIFLIYLFILLFIYKLYTNSNL